MYTPLLLTLENDTHLGNVEYDNSSVGEEEHFEMRHFVAAVLDWQVWLQIVVYFSVITPCAYCLPVCHLLEWLLMDCVYLQCTGSHCSCRKYLCPTSNATFSHQTSLLDPSSTGMRHARSES